MIIMNDEIQEYLNELNDTINQELKNDEKKILIDNKELVTSLQEQIELQNKWEKYFSNIAIVYNSLKSATEDKFAKTYVNEQTKSHNTLSSTDTKYYASANADYIETRNLKNKALGIKNKIESQLRIIESRKYILKDLSALVINGSEQYIK